MTPLIPTYKPNLKLELFGPDDPHPEKLPHISNNRVYLYSATAESSFKKDDLKRKAWVENKIKGPEKWWLTSISIGWHPNLERVQKLCNNEAPASVVTLYHPLWQFRFALGQGNQLLVDNAKFDWEFFWAQKQGLSTVKTSSTVQ
jgi:hypothetical protein